VDVREDEAPTDDASMVDTPVEEPPRAELLMGATLDVLAADEPSVDELRAEPPTPEDTDPPELVPDGPLPASSLDVVGS